MMLFTIGHSLHQLDEFLLLLSKHGIDYVIDVRSTPYSKIAGDYNKESIEKQLLSRKIHYSYMGKYFGARQKNRSLYSKEGYLDFEKVRSTPLFQEGMDSIQKGLSQGYNIALMCTEKDPFDCHRAIMVARGFELEGSDVKHIMYDGSLIDQKELRYEELYAPTKELLGDYQKKEITWDEYEEKFSALMEERRLERDFSEKYMQYHRTLLLCSEPTPEKCHRRLVAEYLKEKLGVDVHHV